jgi:CBS domain-containing protein
MTDLMQVKAATISAGASLMQAEQAMIYQGVRLLFVVNDMPQVEGLVTSTDLRGDRPMRIVNQRGAHYDELVVADVMTTVAQMDAMDYDTMTHATVSNVIATLKRHGRNHLLVVQASTEQTPERVRGVISRAQVERQTGTRIEITEIASSFAEIGQALA